MMIALKALDHQAVLAGLRATLAGERRTLADFLSYLGEVDSRRLYADEGQPSLFAFCMNRLALSESESYARITAARLMQRFPVIHEHLAAGALNLTSLRLISAHLTDGNAEHLFREAARRRAREIEKIVATLVEKKTETLASRSESSKTLFADQPNTREKQDGGKFHPKPDRTRYVASEHVEIKFTANEQLLAKIKRVKDLVVAKKVGATLEDVFGHILESYLNRHDPERRLAQKREKTARRQSANAGSAARKDHSKARCNQRFVAQNIKDKVYERDGGQCTFKARSGERCPARSSLEYDHCRPVALGGTAMSVDDVRLLCRTHNRLAAERSFGVATVGSAIAARKFHVQSG